jgi:hypothetical protein
VYAAFPPERVPGTPLFYPRSAPDTALKVVTKP